MMKQKLLLVMAALALLIIVPCCKEGQKPTPRPSVWSEDSTNVKMSDNKVLVPFKRLENGLAEVRVLMNDVPFNMWWDTGASTTCISLLELQKLHKDGKIELDEDFEGITVAQLADGTSTELPVFNIKVLYIQGQDDTSYLILRDIEAQVVPNAEAPMLLGQNVISQLPKHSFNESMGVIEFDK